MYTVTVSEKGGKVTVREFDKSEVTIGRMQGNDIVLAKSNISKKHARFVKENGALVVVDEKSTNGTYVNGSRIAEPYALNSGDRVFIGEFILEIGDLNLTADSTKNMEDNAVNSSKKRSPSKRSFSSDASNAELLSDEEWGADDALKKDWDDEWGAATANAKEAGALDSETPMRKTVAKISEDPQNEAQEEQANTELQKNVGGAASKVMSRAKHVTHEKDAAKAEDFESIQELGPVGELLSDDSVTEIYVSGTEAIYVVRDGVCETTEHSFANTNAVIDALDSLSAIAKTSHSRNQGFLDLWMSSGIRAHAIFPPVSSKGPCVIIRKSIYEPLQIDELVANAALTADMAEFLEICVKARQTILISGGRGSGKTTTLRILAGHIPQTERIVTIEDFVELQLEQPWVMNFESFTLRNPHTHPNRDPQGTTEGLHHEGAQQLLQQASHFAPDRLILGECQGSETWTFLQAVASVCDGALSTVNAHSPEDALLRLESFACLSGTHVPQVLVRTQVAQAVDIVVQQTRLQDGSRRIAKITEVLGVKDNVYQMQDIFVLDNGKKGKKVSAVRHKPTGIVPNFFKQLSETGLEASTDIFHMA